MGHSMRMKIFSSILHIFQAILQNRPTFMKEVIGSKKY